MSHTSAVPLPQGLPDRLSIGEEGYEALCSLLGSPTTKQKNDIVKVKAVKERLAKNPEVPRRGKQADRLRASLLALYSDPDARREIWRSQLAPSPEARARAYTVPSLERAALRAYEERLLTAEPDPDALADCEGLFSPGIAGDDWRAPALTALPRLKTELESWASVAPKRRSQVANAAFAVATLLEDARLLHWAAASEPDLAVEFGFLDVPTPHPLVGTAAANASADQAPGDALAQLRDRAEALVSAARHLAEGPATDALFNVVTERSEDLLELREPVLALVADTNAIKDLHVELAGLLAEKVKAAPWFEGELEQVLARWQEVYPATPGTRAEVFRADVERVVGVIAPALAEVAAAEAAFQSARAASEEHQARGESSVADRRRQAELSEIATQADHRVVTAMEEALSVLEPDSSIGPVEGADAGGEGPLGEANEPPPARYTRNAGPAATSATSAEAGPRPAPSADEMADSAEDLSEEGEANTPGESPMADGRKGHGAPRRHGSGVPSTSTHEAKSVPAIAEDAEVPAPPADQSVRTDDDDTESDIGSKGECPEAAAQAAPLLAAARDREQEAVWQAVGEGRIGLAHHVANLARATRGNVNHPTPELLEALALGSAVSGPEDELSIEFAQLVGPLSGLNFEACDAPLRDALNLLLFAASLRPALFSSQQGASIRLLRRVEFSGGLAPVRSLAYAVAACAEDLQGGRLDVTRLTAILDVGLRSDWIDDTRERVERWHQGAVSASFIGPARAVWQHWLSPRGPLGELRRLLTEGAADDALHVREVVAVLGDPKSVRDLVEVTHRELGRRGTSIVGNAFAQLERHLNEPRDLAERWLRVIDAGPSGDRGLEGEVERLRDGVSTLGPPALEAVRGLKETGPAKPLANALVCAEAAIEALASILQDGGDLDWPQGPETLRQALRDDLLFVTAIPVDEVGDIDSSVASGDALALLTDTAAHAVDLPDAFEKRLGQGDLLGAHAVCERMEADEEAATERAPVEDSTRRLRHAVVERRGSLERRVFELAGWLEQAFFARAIEEDERAELTGAIDGLSHRLESEAGVLGADKAFDAVAATVEAAIERAVDDVKKDLSEFLPLEDAGEQALVESALEARDVATLREQHDWLRAGQPIQSPDSNNCVHLRAFLGATDRIEAQSASHGGLVPHEVLHAVRGHQDILGLSFSSLVPSQSEQSVTLLECWFRMVRSRSADQDTLANFFTALGFKSAAVEVQGDTKALLQTEPLRVPAVCPDHTFGSDANGRYDVLLNASANARESIIQAVPTGYSRGHTIVLHLGRLTRDDREALRRWSTDGAVPFIAIDECLVLYLASLSEGTLRAMFDCALPFTCTKPYFTAAGLVPPEAFFGREGERSKISDRFGSCFVYGGRQLGKTALLHDVRAAIHSPEQGQLAEYIDLEARDVGRAEGPEHLWHVLWGSLKHLGVVDDGVPTPRGRNRLVENVETAVERWLDKTQDRRILVLLDEADRFLDADLKNENNPFGVSTRLKGLMDRTERRFKAVLCGLHNVLRNTDHANHPLAHFGDPVCVGPLLENGDLRRARELVRNPMAAVGYTFESENLVTKILLWTNYYPSLIQVFCEALLDHLRQVPGRRLLDPITDEEVRRVFGRPELRDRIRGLFSLTLGLDQRYEVVAYAMADELLHNRERKSADGLPRGLIFERVREYWEAGFDIREREFDTLLLEMCGLGVLRRLPATAGGTRFAFRNLNVLHLLGDDEAVLDVLCKEREVPVLFDAPTWHARYPGAKPESRRRGPLTYQQESDLNKGGRVAVVCGTAAANAGDVVDFLASRMEDRVLQLETTTDSVALVRQVNRLRPARPDRATVLHVVNDDAPWTHHWIEGIAAALGKAQRGGSLRVVFRAHPDRVWDLVEHLPAEDLDASSGRLFDWVVVGPWDELFVKQWCSDHALHEANAKTRELFRLTGGWPSLLERYADCPETTWQARADALEGYIMASRDDVLEQLGLGAPATRNTLAPLLAWSPSPLRLDEVDTYAELWAEAGPPVEPEILRRRLFWAMQLGLIDNDNGSGTFNPLVARLLADDGE